MPKRMLGKDLDFLIPHGKEGSFYSGPADGVRREAKDEDAAAKVTYLEDGLQAEG
jgi:hypothetical protein